MNALEELSPAMSEAMADIRKRAWKTRREKYGQRGHNGPYCHPKMIYTARWNERLQSMQDCLIKLYREGVLSEGQVSKATGLDRVSCRDLAMQFDAKARKEKAELEERDERRYETAGVG